MKRRIFFALLLVAAAFFAGRYMSGTQTETSAVGGDGRDEIRESFRLGQNARVEVRGINGSVEVNTAETDTADVHVARTSGSAEDLEDQRVKIEHTGGVLVVRVERGGGGWWRRLWGGGSVRYRVVMSVPRRVELLVRGVNGPVRVGEVEGQVGVDGVNGRVEVEGATGYEVGGVNGNVKLGLARAARRGVEASGINGNLELRIRESLDADIEVKGHNGNVAFGVSNLTTQERISFGHVRARLGAGGTPFNIKGINGNVHFASGAPPAPPAADAPAVDAPAPPAPRAH